MASYICYSLSAVCELFYFYHVNHSRDQIRSTNSPRCRLPASLTNAIFHTNRLLCNACVRPLVVQSLSFIARLVGRIGPGGWVNVAFRIFCNARYAKPELGVAGCWRDDVGRKIAQRPYDFPSTRTENHTDRWRPLRKYNLRPSKETLGSRYYVITLFYYLSVNLGRLGRRRHQAN